MYNLGGNVMQPDASLDRTVDDAPSRQMLPPSALLTGSRHYVHLNCLPEGSSGRGIERRSSGPSGRDRHPVIQMKRLRVPATVVSLWDFMRHLKLSQHQRHNDLILDLVQCFWELYAYCMLSRSHTRVGRYTVEHWNSCAERKYFVIGGAVYRTMWVSSLLDGTYRIPSP